MNIRARYICFEGIDGAGKTSQIALLADRIARAGTTPIVLCEPSYGLYGQEARARMAKGAIGNLEQQRALFTRDRVDHVARKIKPALQFVRENPHFAILQSRSYLSATAYQCDSLDPSTLASFNEEEKSLTPQPDIILLLDLPVGQAFSRLAAQRRPDHFEAPERLEKVHLRYRYLAQITPNCALVDAAGDPSTVAASVYGAIEKFEGGLAT